MLRSSYKSSIYRKQQHPYHIVDPSPWPFLVSLAAMQLVLSFVYYFNTKNTAFLIWSFVLTTYFLKQWFTDIVTEATFEGNHTTPVQRNIRFAMGLFILSEVMFFFGFFWSYFHFSLSPSIWIGCVWPPAHIEVIPYNRLPLLNSVLLVVSGITLTASHKAIVLGSFIRTRRFLFLTIVLGLIFVFCQWLEYNLAQFSFSDSVFGSIFYLMTGFHGLHVIVGLLMLSVCYFRLIRWHFTREHHVGFLCSIWYWHFVDVVWLMLYLFVYYYV